MRLLIIDDDQDLREVLKTRLEQASFAVDVAKDGKKGSFMGRTTSYDVVLLDLCLPERQGGAVCTELRAAGKSMPILVMTVETDVPRKVELLNLGADDYITKPFSFDELLARIRAVTRRPPILQEDVLTCGRLTIDRLRQKVFLGKKEIYLTRKEFSLLEYLARHQGIVVSRAMLLEHVWDGSLDIFTNTIETHIRMLRRKIEGKNQDKIIHTVPGRGYVLSFRR